jgi:hypothetical protein
LQVSQEVHVWTVGCWHWPALQRPSTTLPPLQLRPVGQAWMTCCSHWPALQRPCRTLPPLQVGAVAQSWTFWGAHSPSEQRPSTRVLPLQVRGEQVVVVARLAQEPFWQTRQGPAHWGPCWPLVVGWQRKFWQLLQAPHSASPQQEPSPAATQRPPQVRVPVGQTSLQGWSRPMQRSPHLTPTMQSKSQPPLRQTGLASSGAVQVVQLSPHFSGSVSLAQVVPHLW